MEGAEMVTAAREFAGRAHTGQFRRDGKTPYIVHPARVAGNVRDSGHAVVATAWLHDVVEDTEATLEDLANIGFPPEVMEAVGILTKVENTNYDAYIAAVRENKIARIVKIADITDNMGDTPTDRAVAKYKKALEFLT